MKGLFAVLSLAATLTAGAGPYAPQEFDFRELSSQGTALGTVESVATVRIERDIHAYEEPAELRIQPELRDRIVIRLDDGRALTLVLNNLQRFEAGERVRIVSDTYSPYGPRIFHD
jgi:outer membrane lipoprotein SlyB